MKIILAGGGTGGHFYPLIAIAEKLNAIIDRERIVEPKLYYFSDVPYDEKKLFENGITFVRMDSGKVRTYFSVQNFFDVFKTFFGFIGTLIKVWQIYPDVVVSKGGYLAFPVVLSARILRIPVIIHESDSVPGRANVFAGKFAKRVAVSYPEAATFFPKETVAITGQPIISDLMIPVKSGAREYLHIDPEIPVVLVVGGSLGAEIINNALIDALPELVESCYVIHQTGKANFKEASSRAGIVLEKSAHKERYKPFAYLDTLALKMSAGVASVVVTRAGSMLFEIATWGVPAIVIPISNTNGDHQRKNAYSYARSGAGEVMEENNLSARVLASEIHSIITDTARSEKMKAAAKTFIGANNAALLIAEEIVAIGLSHEQ